VETGPEGESRAGTQDPARRIDGEQNEEGSLDGEMVEAGVELKNRSD